MFKNLLEELYQMENFGIYLFVVIGILLVLFIIVLLFGKRDAKKAKLVENEEQISTSLFKEDDKTIAFEVPVIPNKEEVVDVSEELELTEKKELNIPDTTNFVLNENIVDNKLEEVNDKEFDFDSLAQAISRELEDIDNSMKEEKNVAKEVKPIIEDKEEQIHLNVVEPVHIDEIPKSEKKIELPEKAPERPRQAMPQVFSSVYVNRKTEVKDNPEMVQMAKPNLDLPKKIELPKRSK